MCYRTYSHGGPITEAVIWLGIITLYPLREPATIASHRVRIASAPLMNTLTKVSTFKQSISHSYRTDGIIRKSILIG